MLDLSNNNATGHNWPLVYQRAGQRRVYFKRCEGTHYVDKTYPGLRKAALAFTYKDHRGKTVHAGMRVGAYNYLHPLGATPAVAADYFLQLLQLPLVPARDLRPCLDCEYGDPSAAVGRWVTAVAAIVYKRTRVKPLIYGSGWWLEACRFPKAPGPLWLAAYGRNDGREYPVGRLPHPWVVLPAHQYSSKAHVIGIKGEVDISHVFLPASIDVPKRK